MAGLAIGGRGCDVGLVEICDGSIGEGDDNVGFGVGDGDVKVEDDVEETDEDACFVS